MGKFDRAHHPPKGYYSKGGYYSSFVWRFTSDLEQASFEDFDLEPFDFFYTISAFTFVTFGAIGIFFNGRSLYHFCCSKTVSGKIFLLSKARLFLKFFVIYICSWIWTFVFHEKTKSPFNIILLNLTLVNLLISSVGIFLDMVGTSLRGRILADGFCEFEGFFYMLIG